MGKRRGEVIAAVEVTILIFLITLGMIGYILLLPEEERAALLGQEATNGEEQQTATEVLLSEVPGEVTSTKSSTQTRSLEPMRLYSTTESTTETLVSSLTVSRNIIQNNYKAITFDVENLNDLESLGLLFLITESKGEMTVELNGHMIFEGELTSNDLPLDLPVSYLQEKDNVMKISANFPGWQIFSANYYLLQDVQLLEGYTVADTTSTRTFSIDNSEDVTSATLSYFLTCNNDLDGILTISLNNREVFSDQIFCEYLDERKLELREDYLGSLNTLKFEVTEGDYNIEEATVALKTKNRDFPKFSFDIDPDLYEEILSGEKEVYLKLSFGDETLEKKSTVTVQEFSFGFDTESGSYEKKITAYLDEGVNTISVQPENNFEIDNLKVYVL